jgi:Domain of unknown function (DUF4136)
MIRTVWFLCFAVGLIVNNRAMAQDVRYNFDKDTNFATFKTYKWVELKDSTKVDSLREKEIKDSVDAELAKKGLTRTDSDPADLYVGYQAGIGTEKQFTSYNTGGTGWGYGPGWYGGGWYGDGGGMTTGQTSTIYTGQLVLDMYDSKNHDLVWRGVVSKTIDPDAKPDKQEKNLNKAVAKLLKNYPPQNK